MRNRQFIILTILVLLTSCLGSLPTHGIDEKGYPVIAIGISDADSTVSVRKGQDIEVRLPVVPGTGYGWFVVRLDTKLVRPIGQSVFQTGPRTGTVGSAELQVFRLEAMQKGVTEIVLEEKRPWERVSKRSFAVMLSID
jgi:predicted secreted protein